MIFPAVFTICAAGFQIQIQKALFFISFISLLSFISSPVKISSAPTPHSNAPDEDVLNGASVASDD